MKWMALLKYVWYIIPALTFVSDIIKASSDGKITAREVYDAAKNACRTIGIDIESFRSDDKPDRE